MLHSIFYCEQCREQLETAAAVDVPPYWLELLEGNHPDRALHFCCWNCIRTYADTRGATPPAPRLVSPAEDR